MKLISHWNEFLRKVKIFPCNRVSIQDKMPLPKWASAKHMFLPSAGQGWGEMWWSVL